MIFVVRPAQVHAVFPACVGKRREVIDRYGRNVADGLRQVGHRRVVAPIVEDRRHLVGVILIVVDIAVHKPQVGVVFHHLQFLTGSGVAVRISEDVELTIGQTACVGLLPGHRHRLVPLVEACVDVSGAHATLHDVATYGLIPLAIEANQLRGTVQGYIPIGFILGLEGYLIGITHSRQDKASVRIGVDGPIAHAIWLELVSVTISRGGSDRVARSPCNLVGNSTFERPATVRHVERHGIGSVLDVPRLVGAIVAERRTVLRHPDAVHL